MSLCRYKFSTYLNKYQGAYLLDHVSALSFVRNLQSAIQRAVALCIAASDDESACCFALLQAFVIFSVLDYGHSDECVVLYLVLIFS